MSCAFDCENANLTILLSLRRSSLGIFMFVLLYDVRRNAQCVAIYILYYIGLKTFNSIIPLIDI